MGRNTGFPPPPAQPSLRPGTSSFEQSTYRWPRATRLPDTKPLPVREMLSEPAPLNEETRRPAGPGAPPWRAFQVGFWRPVSEAKD